MKKKIFFVFKIFVFIFPVFLFGKISIPTGLSYDKTIIPNEKIKHTIPIQNNSKEIVTVQLTLVDYIFKADGSNIYEDKKIFKRSIKPWMKKLPEFIKIAPNSTYNLNVDLQVPNKKDLAGTYWAMLLLEPVDLTPIDAKENQIGIKTILRYAYQISLTSEKNKKIDLKFSNIKVESHKEKNEFLIDAENIGNSFFNPKIWINLFDSNGKKIGHFEGNKARLYPTCSVHYKIDIPKLSKGKYFAIVAFDDGKNNVIGADYEFEL